MSWTLLVALVVTYLVGTSASGLAIPAYLVMCVFVAFGVKDLEYRRDLKRLERRHARRP